LETKIIEYHLKENLVFFKLNIFIRSQVLKEIKKLMKNIIAWPYKEEDVKEFST
jgi:hypothetical protein